MKKIIVRDVIEPVGIARIPNQIRKLGNAIEKIPDWKSTVASFGKAGLNSIADLMEGRQGWAKRFGEEWEKVFEDNPCSVDYTKTQEGQDVFSETLKLLNLGSASIKLDVVKSLYLNTLREYKPGTEKTISKNTLCYLRICSELEIEDLIVL